MFQVLSPLVALRIGALRNAMPLKFRAYLPRKLYQIYENYQSLSSRRMNYSPFNRINFDNCQKYVTEASDRIADWT